MINSIKLVFQCFYLLFRPLFKGFLKLGQKYKNIFVGFLVQMKTLKFGFEINWPLVLLLPFIFPGWIIWVINFSKSWCVIPKDNKLDDFGATHLCRGKLESNRRCTCPSFIPNVFESKAFWILVSLSLIQMSHWRHTMVNGAEFWISCKRLKLLRKAGCLQLIQNSAPSTSVWRQCDIRIVLQQIFTPWRLLTIRAKAP